MSGSWGVFLGHLLAAKENNLRLTFWTCKMQVLCLETVQSELLVEIMVRTVGELQGLRAARETTIKRGVRFLF